MLNQKNDKAEVIDLTHILKDYEGKWVVLSKDYKSVLFSGDNVEDIVEYVDLGFTLKVSDLVGSFVPSTSL